MAVLNYLSGDLEDDREALAELAQEGWSRIPQIGRNVWLDHFRSLDACPPELLLEAAGDPSHYVRVIAYEGIWHGWRKLQGTDIGPALTHLEEDLLGDDEDVRRSLLTLLRLYEVPAAAPALRKLGGGGPGRVYVLRALVRAVGVKALPDVREEIEDDWDIAVEFLVKLLGVEAVPELVARAKSEWSGSSPVLDNDGSLRIPADVAKAYLEKLPVELRDGPLVAAIAPLLSPEARLVLVIDALKSDDGDQHLAGAKIAARFHIEAAWPYLIPLLEDYDEVGESAEAALEAIRTHRELKSSFERYGAGGPSKVLEDATLLTKSDDPVKRRGGALAIGALADPAGIPVLLGLLDDKDESVREAALGALERLGGRPKPEEAN
jgi:HEAT repeat protein